jgi:ribosomal protein S3
MNKNYNVLNMLLNYISKSSKIDEKEKVTLLIKTFFSKDDNKEIPNLYKLNITNISIEESTIDTISISIELVEAGLLVGKEGKTIRQLGGFISKNLDKKARIYVKESKLFELDAKF